MLFIFRKLRRSFFLPGKVRTYIAYALGEIALIMIGILLALQVSDWNQARKDRAEETEILLGLKEEFHSNREQLVRVSEGWTQMLSSCEQLLELMGTNPDASDLPDIRSLFNDYYYRTYDPRSRKLKSTIDSGKLVIISNSELRSRVAEWPDLVADMQHDLDWQDEFYFNNPFKSSPLAIPLRPNSLLEADLTSLFGSVSTENWLYQMVREWNTILGEKDEILESTNKIIRLIELTLE